jgi:GAF domain-containing protein
MQEWLIRAVTLSAVAMLFVFALSLLVNGLNKTLLSQMKLTQELKDDRDTLEKRVQQRTTALEKRALEMETASHIARDISTIDDLDQLLTSAINRLKDEFGFYYVAVFLTDESREFALLRAGTGEAGQAMLAQNHRHALLQTSMVGYAITKQEARLAQNVSEDTVHYRNPFLPETRSEIALPLIVDGVAIGALDVQSTQAEFFQPDDIRVLQVAADQLAVAFEKARLVRQLTNTLDDLKSSYRLATQQSWQKFIRSTRRDFAYRLRSGVIEPGSPATSLAAQAMRTGEIALHTSTPNGSERPRTSVAVPVKLRDQALGVLELQFEVGFLSAQSLELLEAAANRLALALDNARLLEEVQMRATREKMVSEVSAKVRAESDVERVLQTVAAELGNSLGVSGVLVQLRGPE